ncbi:MAG: HipA domain-containing protein [Oscillospiraceae bacterium]|nr:HipA domain-containing protein [Oscillospiraceae bacterium]
MSVLGQINVKIVWVDANRKQVGAKLSFGEHSGRTVDFSIREISENYKGKLNNAIVTKKGLRGKRGVKLPHKRLYWQTGQPVATYTLMHADTTVCYVYPVENKIEIVAGEFLPFALTGLEGMMPVLSSEGYALIDSEGRQIMASLSRLTVSVFEQWLTSRVDNLTRTYMNRVYIARKIGRDREKILRDSCAISIIDNFWVRRSDVDTSWSELKSKRDINLDIVNIALTGEIKKLPDFKKATEDTISLFTTKGAFPKAIYKGTILKKDNNAEYEVIACNLGNVLGVSVAKAIKRNGLVECKLFTSEKISMTHAGDLLHLTDYNKDSDEHRALYEYFSGQGRNDITKQLERLYILNYIVENTDLHYENFGFLYDSSSFEITEVAPAYDFNSAFLGLDDVSLYYHWILHNIRSFLLNNVDIVKHLQSSEFAIVLSNINGLTLEQKKSVRERAEYLCSKFNES